MYKSDGTKVQKQYNGKTTDYLDGFQYDNAILQFFPTSEGYFDATKNQYYYNYTDHLGNVRLSYSDADGNGQVTGDIVVNNCTFNGVDTMCNSYIIPGEAEGVNNYYPFGMAHSMYIGLNPYQYKYNGKELQPEIEERNSPKPLKKYI